MGLFFSRLTSLLQSKKPCRVLMVGLDGAGKTTVLYKIKLGEVVTTIPTIGFNVESVEYKNLSMTVWDVGGQERLRPLWRHYYQNSSCIIYVVDSNDPQRLNESAEELHHLLKEDELKNCPLLVFANKQDLPEASSLTQVTSQLDLNSVRDRPWFVQGCCAINSDGLYEGLDWLANEFQKL